MAQMPPGGADVTRGWSGLRAGILFLVAVLLLAAAVYDLVHAHANLRATSRVSAATLDRIAAADRLTLAVEDLTRQLDSGAAAQPQAAALAAARREAAAVAARAARETGASPHTAAAARIRALLEGERAASPQVVAEARRRIVEYRQGERARIIRLRDVSEARQEAALLRALGAVVLGVLAGALAAIALVGLRRRAEAALQETSRRLAEREADLARVSRLSDMSGLASALAHELNQPLAAAANYVRGSQRLLERGAQDPARLQPALQAASEQILRAGAILRRLRAFLSKDAPEPAVLDVPELLRESVELAWLGVREEAAELRFAIAPGAERVLADRTQTQQVLIHLIRNAIEAMAGQPRRELRITAGPTAGGRVSIRVSDTGAGVPEAVAPHLFEPFTTSKPDGMGVSLSICRAIVEAHEGSIWAEPNPGGGTTFGFTLPYAPPSSPGSPAAS